MKGLGIRHLAVPDSKGFRDWGLGSRVKGLGFRD